MPYEKGKLSRQMILDAAAGVVMAKGYAATTMADLAQAADTSAGKLTHHFPTKESLFEAVSEQLLTEFRTGPLARLADRKSSPQERITDFLDGMYRLYALQHALVGCPLGHAAADSDEVSPNVREQAHQALQETIKLFEMAFRDMKQSPALARAKAHLFVSAWQGAVVIARSGEGLKHIDRVFESLKRMIDLS